jgi:hypothetical protein
VKYVTIEFDNKWWEEKIPIMLNQCVLKIKNKKLVAITEENFRVGAFVVEATEIEPDYFICPVYRGTVLAILELSLELVNTPSFWKDRYPIDKEVKNEFPSKIAFADYQTVDKSDYPALILKLYRSRVHLWGSIFAHAIRFFILHECAHAYRCHMRLQPDTLSVHEWYEIHEELRFRFNDDDRVTRRALELDADIFAVNYMLHSAGSYPEEETSLTMCGIAIAMAVLCKADSLCSRTLNERMHPSMSLRVMMLLQSVMSYVEKVRNDDFNEYGKFLEMCRYIFDRIDVVQQFGWAVATRLDQIPPSHPLQQERTVTLERVLALQPVISNLWMPR